MAPIAIKSQGAAELPCLHSSFSGEVISVFTSLLRSRDFTETQKSLVLSIHYLIFHIINCFQYQIFPRKFSDQSEGVLVKASIV